MYIWPINYRANNGETEDPGVIKGYRWRNRFAWWWYGWGGVQYIDTVAEDRMGMNQGPEAPTFLSAVTVKSLS